jgi:hypothetical protein
MAFHFGFDSTNRILGCTFSGEVIDEDLTACKRMAVLLVAFLNPLASIVDFSAGTAFKVTPDKIRELAASPPCIPQPDRLRVIVASSDYVFEMARTFEIEGADARPKLHVVRSTREGWAILKVTEPEFRSISEAFEFDKSRLAG